VVLKAMHPRQCVVVIREMRHVERLETSAVEFSLPRQRCLDTTPSSLEPTVLQNRRAIWTMSMVPPDCSISRLTQLTDECCWQDVSGEGD
jgi:hypothetical protein